MSYKKGEIYLYTGEPYGDIKTNGIYVAEKDLDVLWPIGTVNIITDRLTKVSFKYYVKTLNQK